ncbi:MULTISPECIES: helix-turn-helix domain-containing protein [Thermoanaerobacterium]|uniref:Helix-turn-helix domain-containing protein n=2 Tax=Thermoanaerobacterium TaxID=28895 RepID=W9EFK7_9THEO|nr:MULTISPECIES: helix-turn-helix domain-containing protein [Thermoanaerobacterium]AFK85223.1 helix-turn-helix domain protein [Thermoanaerobacterium saccharolyticum JW/SL-YS485]ETO39795.1 helix-turn-helix domain-containing protein [Thermoanaerobacterium aotearoense SCUT27]
MYSFGNTLRHVRTQKDIPQKLLAYRIGVVQQMISLLEINKRRCPPDIAVAVAKELNAPELLISYCNDCPLHCVKEG